MPGTDRQLKRTRPLFFIILKGYFYKLKFSFILHDPPSTTVSSPSFPPAPSPASHLSHSSSIPTGSPLRKEQASHGLQQSIAHQFEAGPCFFPCIKAGQGNPTWGIGSQKTAEHQGQVLISLLGTLQKTKLCN